VLFGRHMGLVRDTLKAPACDVCGVSDRNDIDGMGRALGSGAAQDALDR
jgi:hypothetical protein